MQVVEFPAMGSRCRVVVHGGEPNQAQECRSLVERIERCWSRFDPGSEVSRINAYPDHLHVVSAPTFELVDLAAHAMDATSGRFNPLMAGRLADLGYRRPWAHGPQARSCSIAPVPAIDGDIERYPALPAVRLPRGARFDPGGIGKGLAADLVARSLEGRVSGATIELGGDIAVVGDPWFDSAWRIGVAHPLDDHDEIAVLHGAAGGFATSSTLGRRWRSGDRELHHILDPSTGLPVETDLVAVTAVAASAAWAEVAAKVVLMGGSGDARSSFAALGVCGIAICRSGRTIVAGAALGATRRDGDAP